MRVAEKGILYGQGQCQHQYAKGDSLKYFICKSDFANHVAELLATSTYIALIRLKVNRKPSDDVPLCRGDTGSNPVVGIAIRQIPLNSHLRFKSNFFISATRGIFNTPCQVGHRSGGLHCRLESDRGFRQILSVRALTGLDRCLTFKYR